MAPKRMDPLMLQQNVKQNASDIQNMIGDLNSWEDSIKTRDKKLLKVSERVRSWLDCQHLGLGQRCLCVLPVLTCCVSVCLPR